MLRFALSQYNAPEYFENGIPESVIDAYVEKIVVFEDHFEWYLRFGGNDPLKCHVNGKEDANPEVILGDSSSSLTELEKHRQLLEAGMRSNLYFCFTINYEQAKAFRNANGQYLRQSQWEDITVEVIF